MTDPSPSASPAPDCGIDPFRPAPSPWVLRFLPDVVAGRSVLDVACGGGRHLRAALALGHPATGVDRDIKGLADLAGRPDLRLIAADLEAGAPPPFAGERFGAVIVTYYLWRPLLPAICAAVADDGMLIFETFVRGQIHGGKPVRDAFALQPNELAAIAIAAGLVIVAFDHGRLDDGTELLRDQRLVQRICAVGRDHPFAKPGSLRRL